jgi:MerR family transcriptional regulator, copper efflux regulator
MNIGEAAEASGVSAKMIRHYESIELIKPAERTASGYRVYSAKDVETLRFIRRSRDLGLAIEHIRQLLALWHDRSRASSDVKRIALKHVEELEAKQRELREMADTLRHLANHCHGDDRPDCPIIQDLAHAEGTAGKAPASRRSGALKGSFVG